MKEYREQSYRQKKSALIKKLNKKENSLREYFNKWKDFPKKSSNKIYKIF